MIEVHNWQSIEGKNNISKWLGMEMYLAENLSKSEKKEVMKEMRTKFNDYVAGSKTAASTLLSNSTKPGMTAKIKADADLILNPK